MTEALLAETDRQIDLSFETLFRIYANEEAPQIRAAVLVGRIECLREIKKWIKAHE